MMHGELNRGHGVRSDRTVLNYIPLNEYEMVRRRCVT